MRHLNNSDAVDWGRVGGFLAVFGAIAAGAGLLITANNTNVGGGTGGFIALFAIGAVILLIGLALIIGAKSKRTPSPVTTAHHQAAQQTPSAWSAPAQPSVGAVTPHVGGQQWPATPAPQPQVAAPAAPAGWYPDPYGRHEKRYWDGIGWSDFVLVNGASVLDPG